jgi:hypothetical protein
MESNLTTKSGTCKAIAKNNSECYNHNQISLIKAADELAAEILQRVLSGNPKPQLRDLTELSMALNNDDIHISFEEFCLLSDPEISCRITENYFKNNVGAILKRMIEFFGRLEEKSAIMDYFTYLGLKYFPSCSTIKDIENISSYY